MLPEGGGPRRGVQKGKVSVKGKKATLRAGARRGRDATELTQSGARQVRRWERSRLQGLPLAEHLLRPGSAAEKKRRGEL